MNPVTQFGYSEPFGEEESVPAVITAPVHAEAVQLHAYWCKCQLRGGLTLGRDLPNKEIARLMSKLSLVEPVDGTGDFKLRLAGSGWLRRFGRDVQGERLSELYSGSVLEHYVDNLRTVLQSQEPLFIDVHTKDRLQERSHIEYQILPVHGAKEDERLLLVGGFFF